MEVKKIYEISIIGKGALGTALGFLLEKNGVGFSYVGEGEHVENTPDIVFLAVPVQLLRGALETNKERFSSRTVFVNGAKGIERDTLALPSRIVRDITEARHYCSLLGPSFADEIKRECVTRVSLGASDKQHAKTIKEMVETPFFQADAVPYFESIELAAAMKNVYAIALGFAEGFGCGANTRAHLVTQALAEFELLAGVMGFRYDTLAIPGIAGDFFLSCSSQQSRNFAFGMRLAKLSPGSDSKEARETGRTIEGYHTTFSLEVLAREYGVRLPLMNATRALVVGDNGARQAVTSFFP